MGQQQQQNCCQQNLEASTGKRQRDWSSQSKAVSEISREQQLVCKHVNSVIKPLQAAANCNFYLQPCIYGGSDTELKWLHTIVLASCCLLDIYQGSREHE